MTDNVTQLPFPNDPAVVISPDSAGFRVIIRGRPDLQAFEQTFARFGLASSHGITIAREGGLDFIVSAAALRKGAGL